MAALVQTYPQQTGTVTMLQTRPSSTPGIMSASQPHANHQFNSSQGPRSAYHGTGTTGYRGSTTPVQPYAFTSTPNLNQTTAWRQYGNNRTYSSPAVPGIQSFDQNVNYRVPIMNSSSAANLGYSQSFGISHGGSRDDSALATPRNITPQPRPQSYLSVGTQPSFSSGVSGRNTPDRYRRPSGGAVHHNRTQSSTLPSSITMVNTNQQYNNQGVSRQTATSPPGSQGLVAVASLDDIQLYNRSFSQDDAKRMRRRSVHTIDTPDFHKGGLVPGDATRAEGPSTGRNGVTSRSAHSRSGSSESVSSTRSSHSRPSSVSYITANKLHSRQGIVLTICELQATNRNVSVSTSSPSAPAPEEAVAKSDQAKLTNNPSWASSSDAATKRTLNPSPLSKPATMANDSVDESRSAAAVSSGSTGVKLESPAAKQLAAINQKGGKTKSKTSRLRRAFSFGSAADFRKAAGGEVEGLDKSEPSRLHKEPSPDEAYDAEQARIAEAQEAAGNWQQHLWWTILWLH